MKNHDDEYPLLQRFAPDWHVENRVSRPISSPLIRRASGNHSKPGKRPKNKSNQLQSRADHVWIRRAQTKASQALETLGDFIKMLQEYTVQTRVLSMTTALTSTRCNWEAYKCKAVNNVNEFIKICYYTKSALIHASLTTERRNLTTIGRRSDYHCRSGSIYSHSVVLLQQRIQSPNFPLAIFHDTVQPYALDTTVPHSDQLLIPRLKCLSAIPHRLSLEGRVSSYADSASS